MKCTDCHNYQKCVKEADLRKKRPYCPLAKEEKIITKFDSIKAMSIDEMVDFIFYETNHCDLCVRNKCQNCVDIEGSCKKYIKEYLESEVED